LRRDWLVVLRRWRRVLLWRVLLRSRLRVLLGRVLLSRRLILGGIGRLRLVGSGHRLIGSVVGRSF
jgi:hypothetical protein